MYPYFRLYNQVTVLATIYLPYLAGSLPLLDLTYASVSFPPQCITPFRSLVLGADTRREMEEWIAALKAANTTTHYYEVRERERKRMIGDGEVKGLQGVMEGREVIQEEGG